MFHQNQSLMFRQVSLPCSRVSDGPGTTSVPDPCGASSGLGMEDRCPLALEELLGAVLYLWPLAGAVSGLLYGVVDPGWVAATVQLDGSPLQAHLTTALTETCIGVYVVVVYAGWGALPITWHYVHLRGKPHSYWMNVDVELWNLNFPGCEGLRGVWMGNIPVCYFDSHFFGLSSLRSPFGMTSHLLYL